MPPAHEADEPTLAASALAYLSLHETYRDRPASALALARTSHDLAAGRGTPLTGTMLATRLARAHAKAGNRTDSLSALEAAEQAFDRSPTEPEPRWISYVDSVELAAQKGACYLDLGLHQQALESLTAAIRLMDELKPTHIRDRVHYLSRVAKCHLAQRDLEQACAAGHQAIDTGLVVGSARVLERLGEFNAALDDCQENGAARDFRERFALFTRTR